MSDSEAEPVGADSFLNKIEELYRFEEKDLNDEDGVNYTNE
jgi:hypothetical protein